MNNLQEVKVRLNDLKVALSGLKVRCDDLAVKYDPRKPDEMYQRLAPESDAGQLRYLSFTISRALESL